MKKPLTDHDVMLPFHDLVTARNRMSYTLASAAEAAKVTKPTVFRWIKAGRLSASKADDGTYRIDPSELHRYLEANKTTAAPTDTQRLVTTPAITDTGVDTLQASIALRIEVEKLKALLETERQRSEEWKVQADRWAQQAERLAIAPPVTSSIAEPTRVSWWPFRRAG